MLRFLTPALASTAILLTAACSSNSGGSSLLNPELAMIRLGGQVEAAEHVSGGLPVQIRASISNPSGETIRLTRLNLVSVGEGGVTIPNTSRPFDLTIPSGETRTFEFWVQGYVSQLAANSPIGSNAPINVRTTAVFSSPIGTFQETYMEQLGFGSGATTAY